MEHIISKERWARHKLTMFLGMNAYSVICLLAMIFVDLSRLEKMWIFNMGADFLGIIVGNIIFISIVKDREDQRGSTMCLVWLLVVNTTQMFIDFICWTINGVPEWRHLNFFVNECFYAFAVMLQVIFWSYVAELLDPDNEKMWKLTRIVKYMGILCFLVILGNIWGHYYFIIDAEGFYHRCAGYGWSNVYPMVLTVCSGILIFRSTLPGAKKRVLMTYILFPVVAMVLQMKIYGISLTYPMMLCSIVLMYTNIFMQRSQEMKNEQLKAAQKENEMLRMKQEHARIDTELDMATKIQLGMLPSDFPVFPERKEFEIYASMDAAKEVGGDFYDLFQLDEDHYAFVMADVSGKGVPAALFMMASKITIKNVAMGDPSQLPGDILLKVNDIILEDNESDMFVTVWLGIYEVSTGILRFANGGHEELLLYHDGEYQYYPVKHNLVLGVFPVKKYVTYELQLHPGDKFFMYTDGVTESINEKEEGFGEQRLLETLNQCKDLSPKETLEYVRNVIRDFCGDEAQFDDITMMSFIKREE